MPYPDFASRLDFGCVKPYLSYIAERLLTGPLLAQRALPSSHNIGTLATPTGIKVVMRKLVNSYLKERIRPAQTFRLASRGQRGLNCLYGFSGSPGCHLSVDDPERAMAKAPFEASPYSGVRSRGILSVSNNFGTW